jgi:hypothetical protein
MAENAPITQYRMEFIAGFEQHQSLVRDTVTTEAVIKGNTATFLVVDSGGAEAKTRGINGLITARADNNTQSSATLVEWNDLVRKTDFNIFSSQGSQREIMQRTTMAVINRKMDDDIIDVLATGTVDTGSATTASLNLAIHAQTILGNNDVPFDGNICALITPAFLGYLMQTTEFSSADYVRKSPLDGDNPQWKDSPGYYDWLNIKWIVHPNLPGKGTSAEKCFMYHKSAVGHAANTAGMDMKIGVNEEQNYSWARCSIYMGGVKLQNTGIVVMNHNGAGFASS